MTKRPDRTWQRAQIIPEYHEWGFLKHSLMKMDTAWRFIESVLCNQTISDFIKYQYKTLIFEHHSYLKKLQKIVWLVKNALIVDIDIILKKRLILGM